MSETITASLTVSGGDTITAEINTLARGPAGPTGASGASTWDDITGTASDVPFLPVAAPAHSEGLVFYDSTDKSLTYYNDEADVSMNIGRELWVRVRNDSGSPILNGKVVYINDAIGQLPTIRLARADSAVTSRVIGIATHDIGNNEFGYVTTTGEVKGLATNAFDDGDLLFLSAVTAGEMTTTAPLAPNRVIQVATVLHAHPTQGKLYCHPETDSIPSTGIVDSTATGRALITAATQSDARTTGLGSGATGDALFTAASASAARTTLGIIRRETTADYLVSDTTPVSIPELTFPVEAGKYYRVDVNLAMQSNSTNGYQLTMTYPNNARNGGGYAWTLHNTAQKIPTMAATSMPWNPNTSSLNNGTIGVTGYAYLRPTASGNVTFTTSQQIAGTVGSTGPRTGSTITVTQL